MRYINFVFVLLMFVVFCSFTEIKQFTNKGFDLKIKKIDVMTEKGIDLQIFRYILKIPEYAINEDCEINIIFLDSDGFKIGSFSCGKVTKEFSSYLRGTNVVLLKILENCDSFEVESFVTR